jgi:drug/metabolite transporter (DMT)-like permease
MTGNKLILGFALAAFGTMILPVGDAIAKYLGTLDYNVFQIAWGRWATHLAILTPLLLLKRGKLGWIPERTGLHTLRALVMAGATVCYFFALRFIALADAAAILFCAPLVITALSSLILGEKVGPRRWIAVALGLFGMLLIVRPGIGPPNWGALLALGATFCFAGYFLLTRKLAGRTPPVLTLWFMAVVGTAAMTPFALTFWQAPDLKAWLLMFSLGAVMALGHLFIIRGLDHIEASAMAPLTYLEIVTATVLGYFLFGDFPDALTWVGCAIVIAAGLFVIYRERRVAQRIVTDAVASETH